MERKSRIGRMLKRALSGPERDRLEARAVEIEKRSGAEIVLALVARSDAYAELPWKAFALGSVAGGALAGGTALLNPAWLPASAALLAVVATLGTGLLALLLCLLVPGLARLLLDSHRAEVETRQYAQSLFLERELFATRERRAALLLVSLFERRVVLLPDRGLDAGLKEAGARAVVARVTRGLRRGRVAPALEEGLAALEEALAAGPRSGPAPDELPNRIIEEAGQ